MEVRVLTADDAAEFSRLRLEALEAEPEAFASSPEDHRAMSLDEIRSRLAGARGVSFVAGAFLDGKLVGTAGFYREERQKQRHRGHVWGVYVTANARGQGIARQLMETLVERAREMEGVEQVQLSVTTTQTAAVRLYRALGFRSYGIEPRAQKIGERYVDSEIMVLLLS
jgi:ribosomal protein S18 acetylase RimI-like enzyme